MSKSEDKHIGKILAVDPSINFCGVAVMTLSGKLVYYSLVRPGSEATDYLIKSKDVYKQIRKIRRTYDAKIILEVPEYWGIAGFFARESDSLTKLSFVCGMIYSIPGTVVMTPSQWKGQLPKKVIANRLARIYNSVVEIKSLNHNVIDAIGIGYNYIELLRKRDTIE